MSSYWWSTIAKRLAVARQVRGPGAALLLLRIAGVAVAVPLVMRLPLPRVRALLEPRGALPAADPAHVEHIIACVLGVLHAGRPLLRRGCLTRGVTLYYFLIRAGLDVTLCFGVGASGETADGFDGHCWLLKDGEPFLEARDPRPLYTAMYSFARRGPATRQAADARP